MNNDRYHFVTKQLAILNEAIEDIHETLSILIRRVVKDADEESWSEFPLDATETKDNTELGCIRKR